ncbi:uncharacterized protein si:dkey-28a3.2 [Rhinichthys klamathensis goyatoka]|uniref:uncharacterized protein si:dkey-28a3.2 n=1 Tax=Rhinichthys klamathensis goyatoka TaxID=3034132 RepID=UPI0024B57BC0|nr:uncharacterized protein si:dkey-28a3.2 [Rhinichthys klamathensis goyatoka]
MKDVTPQKSHLEQVMPCLRRRNPAVDNQSAAMSCKTFSKRRYKPAAEFDDVTLARKREYWRSKKREQRARKSSAKKKIRNENLGLCMSSVSDEPSLQIHKVDNDPTLHNHELGDTDAPRNSSSSGLSESECNATMVPCQKEKWFEKTKLTHVLPKFPETSTNSLKGVMGNTKIKSSVTASSNTDAKTVESLCPIGYSGSTTCIELHPNSIRTQKTKTSMISLNGKQLAASPQSHLPMVLPVHNNQNKPQNCLRPLTSAECKVLKEQSCVRSHISRRRTCAFASKHNTRVAMTEEEIAAKRRENWRIKKREQRAKRAAKLARDRERSLGQRQSSCIVNVSSPANSMALRGINLNSVNPKCFNQQSFGAKFNGSRTQLHVQDTKPNHTASSSGILQPSSSTTQAPNNSKVPHFVHTQKRICQKPTRNSFFGASKVESPEDRHARQKEYWRIKKREQRARLSTAMKARLKEQGALKHHGRRCHNSFNQLRGAQVSRAGAFASSSGTIGGFIQEDGTMTVSTLKTTSESSLPVSHDFSNAKCIGKVRLQVQVSSPRYSDAHPVTKLVSTPCNVSRANQNSLVKSSLDRGAVMGSMTVTIQSETEEERIARLREYWRIKKREQRASRAARLGNGLLRSKVSVLKQREHNKKSNKRDSITSSITKTVCDSSTSALTPKKEHISPPIHGVFSIPEISPCVKDGKTSPCPSLESHIGPPAAANHHATTLQAVASMKKLLEESVCTPEDNNATEMHIKCENEPLRLNEDDLLKTENAKPNIYLQQNVVFECDVSEDASLTDIKLSPQPLTLQETSHQMSYNFCQGAADGSHALSLVAVQPQCRNTQTFSDDGADPKQSYLSQASQNQKLGESDELQRKREYWRLMKRQQRARKANKDAAKNAVLRKLAPQTPKKKTPSTTPLLAMSQDTSTCRQIPIQKSRRRCTKSAGPQTQPTDKSRTHRSQIVVKPNPQNDPQEVIRRRRMQWRIKKQEQRARKAANVRKLRKAKLPPQGQASGQNTTSFGSAVVQSIASEDQLGYLAEPCQTALKEESSVAPNHAMEGPLSQAEWRNIYLMDSDPVNPLLVCMVCGEQQYSLSLDGAKTHIEEVHPNTLSLGELERQGILDAWDKQVAVREHFITHQLQQRC